MKKPIVDHWWTKIVERDSRGLAAAQQKLEEVVQLGKLIAKHHGQDAANNVLESGLIEVALLRCVQFHNGERGLEHDDLHIYYRYATSAMESAQAVIDEEFPDLGL